MKKIGTLFGADVYADARIKRRNGWEISFPTFKAGKILQLTEAVFPIVKVPLPLNEKDFIGSDKPSMEDNTVTAQVHKITILVEYEE